MYMKQGHKKPPNMLEPPFSNQCVMNGMQDPTFEDKRRVLEMFRVEIKISGGVATVTGRLKIEKREYDLQQVAIEFRAKSDAAAHSWPAAL